MGGAILDVRSRRVPNRYWYPFLALAGLFLLRDVVVTPDRSTILLPYGIAAGLCAAFYLFWRLRLYGGADAKAFMVAALLCPFAVAAPAVPRLPTFPPAFDALTNGTLLMICLPVVFAVWNLVRGRVVFPAALLGVPMPLAKARAAHVWPMHVVGEDGALRWRYWQRVGTLDDAYERLAAAGVAEVWVTPKLPFLVPVAAGWLLAAPFGNLALRLAALAL